MPSNLQVLLNEATPLPWAMRPTGRLTNTNGNIRFIAEMKYHSGGFYPDFDKQDKADMRLIDHAVNMLPKLVEALEVILKNPSVNPTETIQAVLAEANNPA